MKLYLYEIDGEKGMSSEKPVIGTIVKTVDINGKRLYDILENRDPELVFEKYNLLNKQK